MSKASAQRLMRTFHITGFTNSPATRDNARRGRVMKKIYLLPVAALLSGCTADYLNNKSFCVNDAYRMYPQNNVLTNVTKYKSVKVPTGQTSCDSYRMGNSVYTDCNQSYTTELQEYTTPAIVDVNQRQRNQMISNCIAFRCRTTHNNQFCW